MENRRAVWLYYWALKIDTFFFYTYIENIFIYIENIFFWIEHTFFLSFSYLLQGLPLLFLPFSFLIHLCPIVLFPGKNEIAFFNPRLSFSWCGSLCITRGLKFISKLNMNEYIVLALRYFSDLIKMCSGCLMFVLECSYAFILIISRGKTREVNKWNN